MKPKLTRTAFIVACAILLVAIGYVLGDRLPFKERDSSGNVKPSGMMAGSNRPENATFIIDGKEVALTNGISRSPAAPGSSTVVVTRIFGTPFPGDLDGAGGTDAAMLLMVDDGGSGTFFYAAAVLNDNGIFTGTNAILLGDRVAPQNIEVRDGMIIANYAERKPGEPMTAKPSIGVSKYMRIVGGKLVEVPKPLK